MNKSNPKTKEQAFAYQFQDDIKLLKSLAMLDRPFEFSQHLQVLKMNIQTYENQTGK